MMRKLDGERASLGEPPGRSRRTMAAATFVGLTAWLPAIAHAGTVTISSRTTSALATSTVESGAAGDITITTAGSIYVDSGTAITVDSDNTISQSGVIDIDDTSDSIGILVAPGVTTSLTNAGTIRLNGPSSYDFADDFEDNRFGILVNSGGTVTGDIIQDGGVISVIGDASAGIAILSDLDGNLTNDGTVGVIGSSSYGIWIAGDVSGDVVTSGSVSALGIDATALRVSGDISGSLTNMSALNTYAYDSLTQDEDDEDENLAQAAQQAGPTVWISGSIDEGLLNNGPDAAELAAIEDGTWDDDETSYASIVHYGGAPTVRISADDLTDIVLGAIGTEDDAYGFINRGSIFAYGIYDGITATAIEIGGSTTGTLTTLENGFSTEYSIGAYSSEADATAISVLDGAVVANIANSGSIASSVVSTQSSTAYGIRIDGTASVQTILNSGTMSATLQGPLGDAIAIQDNAGTLTTIANSHIISATLSELDDEDDDTDDTPAGRTIAIDLTGTAQNVTVSSRLPDDFDPDDEDDDESNYGIFGDIIFGTGNDTLSLSGGLISGDTTFDGGNDTLVISGGTYLGAVDFGAGEDALVMTGGVFSGTLSDSDGTLDIAVSNATLTIDEIVDTSIETATFSSGANLVMAVDASGATSATMNASGSVLFENGSSIAPIFVTPYTNDFSTVIVTGTTITNEASLDTLLSDEVPFIYDVALDKSTGATGDVLTLSYTRKSATAVGIAPAYQPFYEPMLDAMTADDDLGTAFLTLNTQDEFDDAFTQLLPTSRDGAFKISYVAAMTMSDLLRDRIHTIVGARRSGGMWANETIIVLDQDETESSRAFDAKGANFGIGLDDYLRPGTLLGASFSIEHGSYEEDDDLDGAVSISRYLVGAYGAQRMGPAILAVSGNWGFDWFEQERTIAIADEERTVFGEWAGSQYTLDLSLSVEHASGPFSIRPTAGLNYFSMHEDAYAETGGDNADTGGNAVAFAIDETERSALTPYANIKVALSLALTPSSAYGYQGRTASTAQDTLRAELDFGYWQNTVSDPAQIRARFISSSDWFTITATEEEQSIYSVGLGIVYDFEFGEMRFDASYVSAETFDATSVGLRGLFNF